MKRMYAIISYGAKESLMLTAKIKIPESGPNQTLAQIDIPLSAYLMSGNPIVFALNTGA